MAGLAIASGADAQSAFYSTTLSGHQQVPSVATLATANVTVGTNVNPETGERIFNVSSPDTLRLTSPIDTSIGAHIHVGYTGENGPIALALPYENLGPEEGSDPGFFLARLRDTSFRELRETLYDSLTTAMDEGRAYVNVHTRLFAGGEVRGQLINRTGLTGVFDAMAYGEQQNPAVLTDGQGGVYIEVREDSMFVTGAFSLESPAVDVMGTPAHLHFGYFGQNGPIALALAPTLADDRRSGVFARERNGFAVPAGLPDSLFRGGVYLNVHSEAHPAGEIRGQVVQAHSNLYFAHVSEIAPLPSVNPEAYVRLMIEQPVGTGLAQVAVTGSYAGFGASFSELGIAPFVAIGNPFSADEDLLLSTFTRRDDPDGGSGILFRDVRNLTPTQLVGLYLRLGVRGGLFATSGEGTSASTFFYHECKRAFYSGFTAAQAVPNTPSPAGGEIITEYYTSRIEVNGFIADLSSAIATDVQGGFHIHDGLAGSAGPIVAPVGFFGAGIGAIAFVPPFAIVNLDSAQASAMRERRYYYNVHTEEYPMGEVRAQIVPRPNSLLHAVVGPTQASPSAAVSRARGGVLVELDGSRAVASGSFSGLNGFDPDVAGGAHLHAGLPGVAGPIVYPLVTDAGDGASEGAFLPADNTIAIERESQLDSMATRALYVNIHSDAAPSGEIRGQLAPYANHVVATALSPAVTLPYTGAASMGRGTGRLVGEVYDTTLVAYGTVAALASSIDTTIGGGAHLHAGYVAETGPIAFGFTFAEEPDTTGTLTPAENVFALTSGEVDTLVDGGFYANFHTLNAPSGAVRGQMLPGPNRYPNAVDGFSFPEDGDTVRLSDAELATEATIDWDDVADPDSNRVAYYWTLFTDTTAAPAVRTEVDVASEVVFTFGALDTLLAGLGLDSGAQVTVFHRAWSTDGAVVTPGDYAAVTLVRRGMVVGVGELPAGAARLVNTGGARELYLELDALPAGAYRYDVVAAGGQTLASASLQHGGSRQRYTVPADELSGGIYFLRLSDAAGAARTWGFVVR